MDSAVAFALATSESTLQRRLGEVVAPGTVTSPLSSKRLAKALAKSLAREPPQKKPRITAGETEQWDLEYKQLTQWLREHAPKAMLQSASIKYSDEQMDGLEKFLHGVVQIST